MVRNDDLMKGVAIGLGAALLVPVVISALLPIVKPMARSALKMGIQAYEKTRETVDEISETVDDLVAEVEEEMIDAQQPQEQADVTDEMVTGIDGDWATRKDS